MVNDDIRTINNLNRIATALETLVKNSNYQVSEVKQTLADNAALRVAAAEGGKFAKDRTQLRRALNRASSALTKLIKENNDFWPTATMTVILKGIDEALDRSREGDFR
jgi:hypothetical protein